MTDLVFWYTGWAAWAGIAAIAALVAAAAVVKVWYVMHHTAEEWFALRLLPKPGLRRKLRNDFPPLPPDIPYKSAVRWLRAFARKYAKTPYLDMKPDEADDVCSVASKWGWDGEGSLADWMGTKLSQWSVVGFAAAALLPNDNNFIVETRESQARKLKELAEALATARELDYGYEN